MQGLQKEWGARDVVWLTVNSTNQSSCEYKTARANGRVDASQGCCARGRAGRWHAAPRAAPTAPRRRRTVFVVDPAGNFIYDGAIDDRRSSNPADAKLANNYVRAALTEALAGKPVSVGEHHAVRLQRQVLTYALVTERPALSGWPFVGRSGKLGRDNDRRRGHEQDTGLGNLCCVAAIVLAGCASAPMTGKRELMLVANDQKVLWDDAGKPVIDGAGQGQRSW